MFTPSDYFILNLQPQLPKEADLVSFTTDGPWMVVNVNVEGHGRSYYFTPAFDLLGYNEKVGPWTE